MLTVDELTEFAKRCRILIFRDRYISLTDLIIPSGTVINDDNVKHFTQKITEYLYADNDFLIFGPTRDIPDKILTTCIRCGIGIFTLLRSFIEEGRMKLIPRMLFRDYTYPTHENLWRHAAR